MTTIAWDGKTVAADSQAQCGDYRIPESVKKIRRVGDTVYALTGQASMFGPMIAWHQAGAHPDSVPKCSDDDANNSGLMVFKDGRCLRYKAAVPFPEEVFAPDAWGAGCYFAIGAMVAGDVTGNPISAETAVKVAIRCNSDTGGDVMVEEVA